ncbi:hypothetical protein PG985_015753 [Apiospora marii]|uniref:chitinase n=1 Tax=Apiospora marii TaxID=335849 RepID=A0ABR1S689_9PEZI
MHSSLYVRLAAAVAVFTSLAAGFQQNSRDNMAVYWGQNFVSGGQQRLSTYCGSSNFNIIPIAFLISLKDPVINLANGNDNCTTFPGSQALSCPQVAEDIKTCQAKHGKTVMLSIGGATYNEGGFASPAEARAAAEKVWNLFGPNTQTANRPFGSAVVDGFDFDFESPTQNMVPFAQRLRELMDAAASKTKKFYLSAAPQCVYPDVADGAMLAGEVSFDFVMVQFYNNFCGVQNFVQSALGGLTGGGSSRKRQGGGAGGQQSAFNFAVWDAWARGKTTDGSRGSKNPNVKILLGVPASKAAASSGFLEPALLRPVVEYCATFSSFGGVMMWDMSHLFSSGSGSGGGGIVGSFLEDVHGALSLAASKGGNDRATANEAITNSTSNSSSNGTISSGGTGGTPITSASTGFYVPSAALSWSGLALGVAFHSLVGSVFY